MQKYQSVDADKKERQRMLPFHMHINMELLEVVQLTVSMLLEIPSMAANAHDVRKKIISKHFRRLLDYSERQVFTGPPENSRDHVMQAAKALSVGNWKECCDLISTIKIWSLIPQSDTIKEMLVKKIKEEGLRTYLFTYGSFYESIGLDNLAAQFDLNRSTVYAIVSKMIINEELLANIDQPTGVVTLQRVESTRLQYLALQSCEKAAAFVEGNERLYDFKFQQQGNGSSAEETSNQQQRGKHISWIQKLTVVGNKSGYQRSNAGNKSLQHNQRRVKV